MHGALASERNSTGLMGKLSASAALVLITIKNERRQQMGLLVSLLQNARYKKCCAAT